ncbi:Mitochondrial Ribonuclease P Catalytic Subunit [Manis pentadactyla]|nr:Mitochondrial Ribonuclease P Catalytic Subunit [Manis pentadactyla]
MMVGADNQGYYSSPREPEQWLLVQRVLKLELESKTTQAIWWLPMEERNELRSACESPRHDQFSMASATSKDPFLTWNLSLVSSMIES